MLQEKLLSLGDLESTGVKQVNPWMEEAERLTEEHCRELGIVLPRFRQQSTMAGYLYPQASKERLLALNLLMAFLWFADDVYSLDRASSEEKPDISTAEVYWNLLFLLRNGTLPAPTTEHVVYGIGRRVREMVLPLSSEAWLNRLASSVVEHLVASTLPITEVLTDGVADLKKYLPMRALDSGMYPTIDMLELARGIYVPDEILKHPVIHQLRECTNYFAALTNDVFSYQKEVLQIGQRFNLINVLMESHRYGFAEAVHEAVSMILGYARTFETYALQVPDFGDARVNADVQSYVDGLRDQIRATYAWQISTNRYRSPDSPFPELRTLL